MLSKENNELLARTGRDTPMGRLMRRYWLPALLSSDLPEPDGDVMRIRLLGEDLVAFRATDGTVGVLGEHCAHRGVSLYFARNEDCGLRCPYHGWKFDSRGVCVDMPNEQPGTKFQATLRQPAYPCVERGGLVWTYMGPGEPPPLPQLEWLDLEDDKRYISLRVQECNWLQALEGEIDPSHGAILHSRVDGRGSGPDRLVSDTRPHIEVCETDAGVQIASRRDAGDDDYYWRVNQFVFPFWTLVPPNGKDPYGAEPDINGHAWVPIDDELTLCVMFSYNPTQIMTERRRALYRDGVRGREPGHMTANGALPFDPTKPYGKYWPRWNRSNDYGLDRDLQRRTYFSGLAGLWAQDAGCQESMGAISDRSQEHLCSSDAGITRVRRVLRTAVLALNEHGIVPPSVRDPQLCRVRSVGILLPKHVSWQEGATPHMLADGPFAYRMPEAKLVASPR